MDSQSEGNADKGDDELNQRSLTLKEQLDEAIKASMVVPLHATPATSASDKSLTAAIKAEMAVYESSGKRGRCLEKCYQYLLTVPPTSVEAERAFSAAGLLCSKLRSSLHDSSLDTLCFLRSYYNMQRSN